MDMTDVSVEKRILGNKGTIRQLKRDGFIPGIIYSDGDSLPISLKEEQIRSFLQHKGEDQNLTICFDGKPIVTRIKEVQRDPVTLDLKHVDLMPVTPSVLH